MIEKNILKKEFSLIKDLRENSSNILLSIKNKLILLENTYTELLEFNSDENANSLDSLYFQNKLFEYQLKNNKNMFDLINNRIYGNYYKLYKEINKYILLQKYTLDNNEVKEFPIYKDLDNNENYDFKQVTEIYNYIIYLMNILDNELINRKNKLVKQTIHKDCGLNIDNLLDNINFKNSLLQTKVDLFNSNINNTNSFHIKYLTRFLNNSKFFYKQLSDDINIEKKNLNNISDKNNTTIELSEAQNINNKECHDSSLNYIIESDSTSEYSYFNNKYFCNII